MIVPQTVGNLYVVGRCASMTHGGQSAARVTGPCFVMGQAAGTACDLALSAGVAAGEIDVTALQAQLESDGAFLGPGVPDESFATEAMDAAKFPDQAKLPS